MIDAACKTYNIPCFKAAKIISVGNYSITVGQFQTRSMATPFGRGVLVIPIEIYGKEGTHSLLWKIQKKGRKVNRSEM